MLSQQYKHTVNHLDDQRTIYYHHKISEAALTGNNVLAPSVFLFINSSIQ